MGGQDRLVFVKHLVDLGLEVIKLFVFDKNLIEQFRLSDQRLRFLILLACFFKLRLNVVSYGGLLRGLVDPC